MQLQRPPPPQQLYSVQPGYGSLLQASNSAQILRQPSTTQPYQQLVQPMKFEQSRRSGAEDSHPAERPDGLQKSLGNAQQLQNVKKAQPLMMNLPGQAAALKLNAGGAHMYGGVA